MIREKSTTNQIGLNCTIISLELNKIVPHELYEDYSVLQATSDYMLPSADTLTEQAYAIHLLLHPIIVIRHKRTKDRYKCIGGLRSLLLAKSSLDMDQNLSVILIDRPSQSEIELIVNTDILLSPLLMSVRNPVTIGALYKKMGKVKCDKLLLPGTHSKSKLAVMSGYAKNTLFHPKAKSSEKKENLS